MKTNVIIALCLLSLEIGYSAQKDTMVRKGSTVICGNVRFQFLTPSMGRMEYSPTGQFVDEQTVVVLQRKFPPCRINVSESDGWLIVITEQVTLNYRVGSGKFDGSNLRLVWNEKSRKRDWHPGQSDTANLGGITYSLDGARKNNPPSFSQGILSRSGYFILDDSKSPTWNKSTNWIQARRDTANLDWYWIVYGDNYARALKEYSDLTGKIPMIPRYAFGSWITDLNYEYLPGSEFVDKFHYSDTNVRSLVEQFRNENIPLDVLVLDFAWHKFGWDGGYDWSPIFPKPEKFLDWSHQNGVKISINDHPGYANEGILSTSDSHAERVIRELGVTTPPKATYTIDLSQDWKFRIDPMNDGVKEQWYSTNYPDSSWDKIQGGIVWENQGYPNYDGYAWYRKRIQNPVAQDGKPVILMFGGVDDEYDLYINGSKVAHYGSPGSSMWSSLSSTDVTSLLKKNGDNLIVLRVNDWGGGGGISKNPVALADRPLFQGIRFNLAEKRQAEVFMNELHNPLIDQGVDFWWIDGGKGSSAMDGLDSQMWTNRVFYDFTEEHTNKRALVFSRYGGWGNHRYPAIFTGDTYSEWEVLYYEVIYSAQGGNVLMPYITHDIGGFLGRTIPFDLYARWIQFGVFNPLLRLHSAFENPKDGNLRMPWTYGSEGIDLVRKYFTLRYQLLPYIYTYSRTVFDEAQPLNRPLYLEYPKLDEAYKHPDEYFFGKEFLCAPIVDSTGARKVYLPPGNWFDYFSDKVIQGNQTIQTQHSLETFPLFVRDGSIIPTQPGIAYSDQRPLDTLIIDVYGTTPSSFDLYEDDGVSLDYKSGAGAWTQMTSHRVTAKRHEINIAPTKGKFNGQQEQRAYEIRLHGFAKPGIVTMNENPVKERLAGGQSWNWDEQKSVGTIRISVRNIRERVVVTIR